MLLPVGNSGPVSKLTAAADGVLVGFNLNNNWEPTDFGSLNREFSLAAAVPAGTKSIYTNSSNSRLFMALDQPESAFSGFTTLTIGGTDYAFADATLNTSGINGQATWASGVTLLTASTIYDVVLT